MATLAKPTIPEDGIVSPGSRISIVPPLPTERKRQSSGMQQPLRPQTLMRRDASQGLNIAKPHTPRNISTSRNLRAGSTNTNNKSLVRDHSKGLVKAPQRSNLDENLQTSLLKQAIDKKQQSPPKSKGIWDTVTSSIFGSSGGEDIKNAADLAEMMGSLDGEEGSKLDVSHWQKMEKEERKREKQAQKENKVDSN